MRLLGGKLGRRWEWVGSEGLKRVASEQLYSVLRLPDLGRKWWWRRRRGVAGEAMPLYVVGVQRSGTNMLVRAFDASPEVEVHNEGDRTAFHRYRLRSDDTVAAIVGRSRHRFVVFKPLCDSHRVDELLDQVSTPRPGRAIWAYRSVDDRVRSAVAKFGDVNRRVLLELAAGNGEGRWQAERLSDDTIELIRGFDLGVMTAESAAALFWYVRNSLYFELGLHGRADVALSSYDSLVADPEGAMRRLCRFVGLTWHPRLVAHIRPGPSSRRAPLLLDPRVRRLCDELQARLDASSQDGHRPLLSDRLPGPL